MPGERPRPDKGDKGGEDHAAERLGQFLVERGLKGTDDTPAEEEEQTAETEEQGT
ncbi:MAG TPA: hypothetical protein VGO92_02405 [Acidimicrobiales bacterium]|jgi:hypothetical protein|nr:hypothetical protein [Acidimicrobiales bacterium]